MLLFIKHVLESSGDIRPQSSTNERQDSQFRIGQPTEVDRDTGYESGDSDDNAPDSEVMTPNHEMVETAVNLLLSILEGMSWGSYVGL
jgi:hypothetical protein